MRGFRELDRILRGDATTAVAPGQAPAVSLVPLVLVNVLLAAGYGVCMGFFGVFGRAQPDVRFVLADAVKVPLLFVLTVAVTFPSLYVFNALVGSRLGIADLARLMASALGVLVAVLAAFGPIVAFFSVTTTSYPFIVLLNVAVFALAAGFAVAFLQRAVDKHTLPPPLPPADDLPPADEAGEARPRRPRAQPRPEPDPKVRAVFRVWFVVFALVGGQMSWVLRPFIGSPAYEFAWFRPRDGSFFAGVMKSLQMLFGG